MLLPREKLVSLVSSQPPVSASSISMDSSNGKLKSIQEKESKKFQNAIKLEFATVQQQFA